MEVLVGTVRARRNGERRRQVAITADDERRTIGVRRRSQQCSAFT
jgi:hypothetical protein